MKFPKTYALTKWRYFPFVILIIGMIIIHASIKLGWGDDKEMFFPILHEGNWDIYPFIADRYYNWSSRIIIDTLLTIMVHIEPVWRILDIAIMVIIAICLSKLVPFTNERRTNWVIICILFMYPFNQMGSAGWIATTLNYLWPLAFGLVAMLPIEKIMYNKKILWYEYLLYIPALIFAANQEQMCVILFAVYFMFTMYLLINKKISGFLILQTSICVMSIIFILTAPGNAKRKVSEVGRWFPDYNNISFLRKIEMGFSSSWFEFVMKPNVLFSVFCLLLLLCMVVRQNKKLYTLIASIPLASSLIFGLFNNVLAGIFPGIIEIKNSMTKYGTGINFVSLITWIPDIILTLVFISIIISLFVIFANKKYSILAIFIILLGFGSRMLMAFSPTIWASVERTYIFMYFSFLICSIMLFQALVKFEIDKYDTHIKITISVLAVLSFLNTLYLLG